LGARASAFVGDFCVDSYYIIDSDAAKPSLETGILTRPVREQRSTLGGAGNVAANLRVIGATTIRAFAVIGADSLGLELMRLLAHQQVDTSGVIIQSTGWQTNSYLKPIVNGEECHRYDFGVFNALTPQSERSLLGAIAAALPELDVLVVNQQFEKGIHTEGFQAGLNDLLRRHPRVVALVDCRHLAHAYPTGMHKLNDLEATRLCGIAHTPQDAIPRKEAVESAVRLFARWKRPVFVTRGPKRLPGDRRTGHSRGSRTSHHPKDRHGRRRRQHGGGHRCLSRGRGLAGRGGRLRQLCRRRHRAETSADGHGLAGRDSGDRRIPDYVYQPELAEDIRHASYLPGTAFEIAEPLPAEFEIHFAIFDQDGTLSTLRRVGIR